MRRYVSIIGSSEATPEQEQVAFDAGRRLADQGVVVVTGGLGGVMDAAARGVASAGGLSLGLLPGTDRAAASPSHALAIPTGLGELRNGLVVRAADVVLAIGGSWGTLSEIALAVRTQVPVVGLLCWPLPEPGVRVATDIEEAVGLVLGLLDG